MEVQQTAPVAFSGSIPANYETYLGPLFFEPFAKAMIDHIRPMHLEAVLEVACGTGRVTKYLPNTLHPSAQMVITDINPAMVEYAKKVCGTNPRFQWDIVDAVKLPYKAAQFDGILSAFGVMFYSDRRKAYEEAMRVLKPGGVFVFTAWDKMENNPSAHMTTKTLQHFFPENTPAFYHVPFSYWHEPTIHADLTAAGFTSVQMELLNLTGHADSPQSAARGLLEGTPVYTEIIARDESVLAPLNKHLAALLEKRFGSRDLKVPLQARLVTAIKG
jgi:SAM-dependent methyltransferase